MAPIISTIEGRLSQLYIDGWYIHVSNYNDENYIKVLIYVLMAYDHELVWNNKKSHSRKICPPLMHYFPEIPLLIETIQNQLLCMRKGGVYHMCKVG